MTAAWAGTENAAAITAWGDSHVGWLIGEGVNRVLLPPESHAEEVAARRKWFAEYDTDSTGGIDPHELMAVCEVEWHLLAAVRAGRQVATKPEADPGLRGFIETVNEPVQSLIRGLDTYIVDEQRRLERHGEPPSVGDGPGSLRGDAV